VLCAFVSPARLVYSIYTKPVPAVNCWFPPRLTLFGVVGRRLPVVMEVAHAKVPADVATLICTESDSASPPGIGQGLAASWFVA
jgi:hypothetical protein